MRRGSREERPRIKYSQAQPMEVLMGYLQRIPIQHHKKNPFFRLGVISLRGCGDIIYASKSTPNFKPPQREKLIIAGTREFLNYKKITITEDLPSPEEEKLNYLELRTPSLKGGEGSRLVNMEPFKSPFILPINIPTNNSLLAKRSLSPEKETTNFFPQPPAKTDKRRKSHFVKANSNLKELEEKKVDPRQQRKSMIFIYDKDNMNDGFLNTNSPMNLAEIPKYRDLLNLGKLKGELKESIKFKFKAEIAPSRPTIILKSMKRKTQSSKTLIFDLDETLVVVSEKYFDIDTIDKADLFYSQKLEIYILLRPHAREILMKLRVDFEIIIFTAADKIYADEIIDTIDPNYELFDHRLYREHCSHDKERFYKDLSLIKNRDIENLIIIDDALGYWPRDIQNLIPVLPFTGEEIEDKVLLDLYDYLLTFRNVDNTVIHNTKWLRILDLLK